MSFRLETLLRLRKNQENLEQQGLATMQAHLMKQQRDLESMESDRQQSKESLKNKWSQPLKADTLILYDNFFRGLETNRAKQEKVISEVTEQATAKRVELTEAMRKRRTLEILKEQEEVAAEKPETDEETAKEPTPQLKEATSILADLVALHI